MDNITNPNFDALGNASKFYKSAYILSKWPNVPRAYISISQTDWDLFGTDHFISVGNYYKGLYSFTFLSGMERTSISWGQTIPFTNPDYADNTTGVTRVIFSIFSFLNLESSPDRTPARPLLPAVFAGKGVPQLEL